MKRFLKALLILLFSLFPRKKNAKRIYIPSLSRYGGGPGRFLRNFESAISKQGIQTAHYSVSGCFAALIPSNSPGDFFFSLCRKKAIRTVLRVDGFYLPERFNGKEDITGYRRCMTPERKRINQRLMRDLGLADRIVYQSKFSKEMADRHLYERTGECTVVYNGVDTRHFVPRDVPGHPPRLLVLGRLRDPDLMYCQLETFGRMNRELDCELKIVGSMTKAVRNILDTWMRRHPALASKIRIRGAVGFDTLPREIADCDVSLHLKSGDWCPNAVLEAMAGGVPVVCSRFGGTVELVGDGGIAVEHAPFVHDDELASKAAAAIREVIRKHAAFSERARRIAEQSFSLERIAECYCRVLKGNAP